MKPFNSLASYIANIPAHQQEGRDFTLVDHEDLLEWHRIFKELTARFAEECEDAGGVPNACLAYQEACNVVHATDF